MPAVAYDRATEAGTDNIRVFRPFAAWTLRRTVASRNGGVADDAAAPTVKAKAMEMEIIRLKFSIVIFFLHSGIYVYSLMFIL